MYFSIIIVSVVAVSGFVLESDSRDFRKKVEKTDGGAYVAEFVINKLDFRGQSRRRLACLLA